MSTPLKNAPIQCALGRVEITKADGDQDLMDILVSDATVDRHREVIDPAGWRLDAYLRNPVVLAAHNSSDLTAVIARAEITEARPTGLFQRWRFAASENPLARLARDLYAGGFLRAASVGFIPIRWEDAPPGEAWRRKYIEQELIEVSAVPIPANPNAVRLALDSGALAPRTVREAWEWLADLAAAPPPAKKDLTTAPAAPGSHGPCAGAASWDPVIRELQALTTCIRSAKKW